MKIKHTDNLKERQGWLRKDQKIRLMKEIAITVIGIAIVIISLLKIAN